MTVRVLVGDALAVLRILPSESVQCVVTSPPYFSLRAYGTDPQVWGGEDHEHEWGDPLPARKPNQVTQSFTSPLMNGASEAARSAGRNGQTAITGAVCPCGAWRGELGSEPTPALFIEHLLLIFDEVWRVLRPDGLCFVNLGDSYSGGNPQGRRDDARPYGPSARQSGSYDWSLRDRGGIPAKNLLLMPYRFAIAMQDAGWIVRSCIVWAKTSAMPESVRDRPTSAWEPIWMFSKSQRYFYDGDAVRQPHARLWDVATNGKGSNFAGSLDPSNDPVTQTGHRGVPQGPHHAGASLRNVWTLGPEPSRDEHYASFVTEIPKRCILAGTSEKGACPACGAPWVRVVERTRYQEDRLTPKSRALVEAGIHGSGTGLHETGWQKQPPPSSSTLGWAPSCSCPPADPVPCVVLDPFLGSGTTALVADRLGRDAIGIELNEEYAEMARRKIERDAGSLFAEPVTVEAPRQIDLFGEVVG